jgi:hypothetical protein
MNCRLFYRPYRNGTYFTEGMQDGAGGWKPYKIWVGDLWKCKGCGHELIVGVAREPLSEHYRDDFDWVRVGTGAEAININDC